MARAPEKALNNALYFRNLVLRFAPRFPFLYDERGGERRIISYRLHQLMQAHAPFYVSNWFSGQNRPNMQNLGPVIYNLMDSYDAEIAELEAANAELEAEIAELRAKKEERAKVTSA